MPTLCLSGPTEKYECTTPARKAHAQEMNEKAGSISNTFERWPVLGDMRKVLSTKPKWGQNRPQLAAVICRTLARSKERRKCFFLKGFSFRGRVK